MNDSNRQLRCGAGLLCWLLFCGANDAAAGAPPVVSNVRAAQRSSGTAYVDITYDLADPDSSGLTVTAGVSTNAGATWFYPGASLTGQARQRDCPPRREAGRLERRQGLADQSVRQCPVSGDRRRFQWPLPTGMALIPAGSFTMGNCMDPNEGIRTNCPCIRCMSRRFTWTSMM